MRLLFLLQPFLGMLSQFQLYKTWEGNVSLFKPATNQTAYLKLGIYGFQGSGKTYTAIEIAKGVTELTKGKTIAFFDTEKGSDFHIAPLKKKGIQLDAIKSRSFSTLIDAIKEAEKAKYSFLIIDSITHVWRELSESYLEAKVERIRKMNGWPATKKVSANLNMKDWMVLKTEWFKFSDLFVNSALHIAACGRAGHEYDISEDEEGKQEIVKSGTKMKAEGEFGYESDLLLEMFRVQNAEITKNKKAKGYTNRCLVLKDRTDTINAKIFDKPKFKDFLPVFNFLNIGGEHVGVDTSNNSAGLFGPSGEGTLTEQKRLKEIALEELASTLILAGLDGRSSEAQKKRLEIMQKQFGVTSKTAIEAMDTDIIKNATHNIKAEFNLLPVPATNELPPPVTDFNEQINF